jgi:uncharacterized protein
MSIGTTMRISAFFRFSTFPFALLIAMPLLAQSGYNQQVFEGRVGAERLRVGIRRIDERTNELVGVSIRPKHDIRVLTGPIRSGTVVLHEYSLSQRETGVVVGEVSQKSFRGTWSYAGNASPFEFDLAAIPAGNFERDVAFERPLHLLIGALRTGKWKDAIFFNRFLCAFSPCDLATPLQSLAADKAIDRAKTSPELVKLLEGFDLESSGDLGSALSRYKDACVAGHWSSFIACGAYFDHLSEFSPLERKVASKIACRTGRGCEDYLGKSEFALIDASGKGDVAAVERLLAGPVNVNTGEYPMPTPLLAAVRAKSPAIVKLLLDHGADPNRKVETMETPLEAAGGQPDIALLLLQHGANVTGDAFVGAVVRKYDTLVDKMLAGGVDPNEGSSKSTSPLLAAVDNGDIEMTRKLLAHGADVSYSAKYTNGTAIDHARGAGRNDILQLLLHAAEKQQNSPQPAAESPTTSLYEAVNCGMTTNEVMQIAKTKSVALAQTTPDLFEATQDGIKVQVQFRAGKVVGKAIVGPGASAIYCAD